MDTYTMAISQLTSQMAMGYTGTSTDPFGGTSADTTFAQLLSTLTGSSGTQSYATNGGYATTQETGGLTWRDIQAGMVADAMKAITGTQSNVVTDPVLAGILQLMQNLAAEGGLDSGGEAELLKLLEKMQDRLSEMLLENGGQIAGQQLLAVMQHLGEMFPNLGATDFGKAVFSQTDGSGLLQMVLTTDAKDLLTLLTGNTQPQADVTGAEFAQAMDSVAVPAAENTGEGQGAQDTGGLQLAESDVVSTQQQTAEPQKMESAFQSAVRTVKEQLGKAEQPAESGEEIDIDALQKKVDAGAYLQNTAIGNEMAAEKPAELPPAPMVQVTQGVQTAIAAGNNQFTITLAPENLGEVTIRLVQTAEGMKLDLIAKNPETQRLLAGDMEHLRESLKPMRVEVDSILTERQDQMLSHQQHFDGQNRQNWRENEPVQWSDGSYDLDGEESYLDVAAAAAMAPQSALNTYV